MSASVEIVAGKHRVIDSWVVSETVGGAGERAVKYVIVLASVCLMLGGCGRPATAKVACSSLGIQVSSDSGVPEAFLDNFQKRLNLLLFGVAKIRPGSACELNVAITTVAPGILASEPDPLHFDLPREGAGRAIVSAQLKRGDEKVWSNGAEMVFAVDTPEVRTSMLLKTFFEAVDFADAINPFEAANADVVYANLCTLSDSHLVPEKLASRVRVLRYTDLSSGGGLPCLHCWSLLTTGGVDKILFDPLGPEEKEFEAAFGAGYRSRYLSALQAHLNVANSLTGEPVALTMIGLDKDRVPILQAEPAAGTNPDAALSFDYLGLNLGANIGKGSGNRAASITSTTLELFGQNPTILSKRTVTYGRGNGVNDCSSKPGVRTPRRLTEQFSYLNGKMK
jgi:hypothetical protein